MARIEAPEDLVGRKPPLEIDVRCARCETVARVRTPWVTIDPRVKRGVEVGWDGVALGAIFTCAACGAVDAYEVVEESYRQLVREKETRLEPRVIAGATQLWDGTDVRRPAAALVHLRQLTEARPESAEAWRRLGNFCERYGLRDEMIDAWKRAVEVGGDDEFEAVYSLAAHRFATETEQLSHEAAELLRLAVQRFAKTSACRADRRIHFALNLAALLFDLAHVTRDPIVLMASWSGGLRGDAAAVHVSSAELGRLSRPDTLGPFLARTDLFALDVVHGRQSEGPTNLERLLDARSDEEQDAIERYLRGASMGSSTPVRVEPKPGRNDACPCGSGKKYKKCHGR
jgi:tetratricopeptide (TPR) repeat protein